MLVPALSLGGAFENGNDAAALIACPPHKRLGDKGRDLLFSYTITSLVCLDKRYYM